MDEEKEKETLNKAKKTFSSVAKKAFKFIGGLIGKKFIIIFIVVVVILILLASFLRYFKFSTSKNYTAGKYSSGQDSSENSNTSIYRALDIEDVSELVTLNGTPQNGYTIAFVDDIDKKLQEVIDSDDVNHSYEGLGMDTEDLKDYIKAELITQIPDLGKGVPNGQLPDLNGVDINNEQLKEDNQQVSSMDGFLMLGDSYTVGIQGTDMLKECQYKCVVGVSPQYWLTNFSQLPSSANGVCVLLGINDLSQISQMKQLIDKLVKKYKDKPIYVQKVFPLGDSYSGSATMDGVNKFNKEINQYCTSKDNVYFIDTTNGYVDDDGKLISNDGLHPKEYKTLVSNIKNKIVASRINSSSDSTELQGNNAEEAIWGFLLAQGFSEEAAAGMMGNWKAESGFRSNAVQGDYNMPNQSQYDEEMTNKFEAMSADDFAADTTGGGGYGLAQWTSPGRKKGLHEFALKKQHTGLDDLKMQLDYVMKELEDPAYSSLLEDDFKKKSGGEQGAEDAAITFHRIYEGSNDSADAVRNNRGGAAKEIYNTYQGTVPSGTFSSSSSSSRKIITVTDRKVDKENEFQGAIQIKRVIPNKQIGELAETTGKVVEMSFVPEGVFNAYLNQNNQNVLEVYTLNSKGELIFAKWSYSSDGGITLSKATPIEFSTVLDKYALSYNYLMILNIHGEDVDFCRELAQTAIDSEFVIAIQDEVTTKRITTTYEETDEDGNTYTYTVTKDEETDKQNVELTYADSWFVKVYNKKHSYSEEELNGVSEIEGNTSDETIPNGNVTTRTVINKYESGKTKVEK